MNPSPSIPSSYSPIHLLVALEMVLWPIPVSRSICLTVMPALRSVRRASSRYSREHALSVAGSAPPSSSRAASAASSSGTSFVVLK